MHKSRARLSRRFSYPALGRLPESSEGIRRVNTRIVPEPYIVHLMAGEKHLYCVASGGYVDSDLSAEHWQCGIRLWADVSVPEDFGTLPNSGNFEADSVTVTGDAGTITSTWKWTDGIGTVIVPADYLNEQAGPAWAAWMAAGFLSSHAVLQQISLYPITTTGQAFEHRSAHYVLTDPVAGSGSGNPMPTETSLAVSWKTPQIGRRGRGRIYPPPMNASSISTDGFANTTSISDLLAASVTLLQDLAVEGAGPTTTHVRPIVTGAPWTQYGVITEVNVGNVFDAQRRRRRQLVETRVSASPTYG